VSHTEVAASTSRKVVRMPAASTSLPDYISTRSQETGEYKKVEGSIY